MEDTTQEKRSPFEALFDLLRQERNRCRRQGDVGGARGFDRADAELRTALYDAEGGI
jgi:hypothetical protein